MPPVTKAQQKLLQAAKDSFNRTYAAQYGGERWQQLLYSALEAPTRYAVLINCYAATAMRGVVTEGETKGLQAIPFSTHAGLFSGEPLVAYQSEAETPFPAPQRNPSNRLMTHWNLDAASLLAVTVLDPGPGDKVLDLCAAPGGKSVSVAQLLRPPAFDGDAPSLAGGCLHGNELNPGRNKRLAANLEFYLPAPFS